MEESICSSCMLRYNCDDTTMFLCKTSNFGEYKRDDKCSGYWKTFYECSKCGEIVKKKSSKCPFCHSNMV